MLTEPVTVFFKFVIGRYEFFVKASGFRHTGHKNNFTCILQLLDNLLFLKTGNSVKILFSRHDTEWDHI